MHTRGIVTTKPVIVLVIRGIRAGIPVMIMLQLLAIRRLTRITMVVVKLRRRKIHSWLAERGRHQHVPP